MVATPPEEKTIKSKVRDSIADAVIAKIGRQITRGQALNNRFAGRRVRGNRSKLAKIRSRERRLKKHGYSLLMFAS